jgi:hypothetical protein
MDEQDCILLYFAKQGIAADAKPWTKYRQEWNSLTPVERESIRDELRDAVTAYIGKVFREGGSSE